MTYPKPRPSVLEIKAYVGGEAKAAGAKLHRLASNENPLGASPRAIEAYRSLSGELHRYPDGSATMLRQAIADQFSLPVDQIVCGAGSDELLSLLVGAYAGEGDEIVYSRHGFLMYPILAKAAGATPVSAPEIDLRTSPDAIIKAITPRTKMVMLANPNNPTGSFLTTEEIRALHARIPPDVLLVLDSAYAEYVVRDDYTAGHELVDEFQNVVMTRTFSKIYGLAALRLGWCYCPPHVADVLNRVRGPFNVNAPAIAAGVAAVQDTAFVDETRAMNDQLMPWLAARMEELHYRPYPSLGNFLLVSFPPHNAEEIRLFLKSRGVLVRQMGAYGLADCLRITIGRQDDMEAVVDGIRQFQRENPAE